MSGSNNEITNTGGPVSSTEPSMEEILASIRRILKDEQSGQGPQDAAEDEEILVLDSSMVVKPAPYAAPAFQPEPLPAAPPPAAPPPAAPEPIPAEPIAPAFIAPEPEAIEAPEPEAIEAPEPEAIEAPEPEAIEAPVFAHFHADFGAAVEEQPPHLTSELTDPDFPPVENATVDLPASEPVGSFEPAAMSTDTGVPGPTKDIFMSDEVQENFQPPHGLVSDSASNAAASSIGSLIRSIGSERSVAISRPGLTLEDLVREELRPLLKSWLDSNLPPLVERIVRAEIQRVVERTGI